VVAQGNAWRRLLNLIMQLRKVVNHPFMMPDSEPRGDGTSTLPELLDASGRHGPQVLLRQLSVTQHILEAGVHVWVAKTQSQGLMASAHSLSCWMHQVWLVLLLLMTHGLVRSHEYPVWGQTWLLGLLHRGWLPQIKHLVHVTSV
jgi:hypothetical protein